MKKKDQFPMGEILPIESERRMSRGEKLAYLAFFIGFVGMLYAVLVSFDTTLTISSAFLMCAGVIAAMRY